MAKRLILILLLFLVADVYFYQAVSTLTENTWIRAIYWSVDVLLFAGIIAIVFLRKAGNNLQRFIPMLITAMLVIFIPKLFSFPILLAEDIVRLLRGFPARSLYVSEATLALAVIMILIILFGLTRGKHFYRVRKETLYFPDLPEVFDGFTITQLSDIHSGSLNDIKGVQKGIDLANAQNSDLLLFTGDLVNNMATEMDPWIPYFTKLKAPYGKYSVLGNHDYGDYIRWDNKEAKEANLNRLKEVHAETGFRLLLNEAVIINKQGQSIALVGVENWGKGGFHQYGDLKEATAHIPDDAFKILMSHDPSHWDEVTVDHNQHVHLTLAGHTHGMQFGIELFGFKWSPIQYFYKQWAGLYQRDGKYLYVNRGFGYHGLKGRVGVWPEITVLTLKRKV
ncbi:Ser/Thr phosphatase family protein [Sphingobacterium spiritivorum ATCC 33300]|uniref:Ser/Thr phosphatase family protein n=2 Tax=Sphingobacterium spiritivorum TaxID=258 RepID=D7VSA9_SPHSI|nr:metallophosphoesterase [Sphingobacterium spiritivorum]EEI90660.1 Ser/Thr phosphatase family protein [Sphingobacterium spiritivorum ATCC 33300]EFK56660.1 Ser/Thr phosphatase family protein [Sphingobacterium spiritivorum ATCC 33861]QQS95518.1 metallophosphoesterase [Sphingobacterium spiritivorum]QQT35298.1 metallophosphoesterase [Sphingobacterium spiritivorum]WQD36214.1 metallophosphoesterase [Sphingobacterium spiritivorum]